MTGRDGGLILRSRERARFRAIMGRKTTTLVLLSGSTNSGKSTLMYHVRLMAEQVGWRAIPATEKPDISLISTSTATTFVRDLGEELGEPSVAPDSIVELLKAHQPVIVDVEAHRLSPTLAEWIVSDFVDGLKSAGVHAVVTIEADLAIDVRLLRKGADEHIRLAGFDADEVRRELAVFRDRASPPISDAELEAYVAEGSSDPIVLVSLIRLLRASSATAAPESK